DRLELDLSLAPGETPDLKSILEGAGVGPQGLRRGEFPAVVITNSKVRLRLAPDRPAVLFHDLTLSLRPVQADPERLALTGTMLSPLGHRVEIRGGANLAKKEFRAHLVMDEIPIQPDQAAAFQTEAAEFLAAAGVRGTIRKTTVWIEAGATGVQGGISAELA